MAKLRFAFLLLACLIICSTSAASETSRPLRQTELLALVAGKALPENIVNEIRSRGVAFHADDTFRTQLTAAGASASILSALAAAKVPAKAAAEDRSDPALLQHMAAAAKLMQEKHYDEAADELTDTLKGNFEKFEIGFVMGELLRRQERYAQAAEVYAEVLRQDPNFPEAHTKLSYLMYRLGQPDDAVREARIALARSPENAEAHKNAGLGLENSNKFDAAIVEYQEALRIKPDYQAVHYDLGLLFYRKRDWTGSITEYKKAILLNPTDVDTHYNLGVTFFDQGDMDSAIREYREAKRLDPTRLEPRASLGNAFLQRRMNAEAVQEFRELVALAPNLSMYHQSLAVALRQMSDLKSAEGEFRKASMLDPSNPEPLVGLGAVQEDQKHYAAAIVEYRKAIDLDQDSGTAHRCLGRVLLDMKNIPEALIELRTAEALLPSEALVHELYAQALQVSGDLNAAVSEFQQSLGLDAKQVGVRVELADALEKKGDWPAALDQYRQASLAEHNESLEAQPGVSYRVYGAPKQYSNAQERFGKYLESLKRAGKASDAAELEKAVGSTQAAANSSEKLDSLMQSGSKAIEDRRFDDAERLYKEAVQIAEKLSLPELRLTTALLHLGQLTMNRKDFNGAQALFQRQLEVTEKSFGAQSPRNAEPLKWLAFNATAQGDSATAQRFFDRVLDLNRKAYGENSTGYSEALRELASVYIYEQAYDKAEPYLIQAAGIEERLYGYRPGAMSSVNLYTLCAMYEQWDKPEKLEACDRRLIAATEKQFGPDSQFLEPTLTREAKTLRALGRAEEAGKVEQRLKSLQPSAANNPN